MMWQCRLGGYGVAELSLVGARNDIKRAGEDLFSAAKRWYMKYRITALLNGLKDAEAKGTAMLLLMGD
jgi:hypothetical protein